MNLTDAQRQALAELWNGPIERHFEFGRGVQVNTLNALNDRALVTLTLWEKVPVWRLTSQGRRVTLALIADGVIVEKRS